MALHGTSDPNNQDVVPTQLRRGDTAVGTDGLLGTVEQIVVDQDTGEQRAIVIRRGSDGAEFEVPVDQVRHLAAGELHLNLSRADLDNRPDLARPYDPDQYVPVYPGDTAPGAEAERTAQDTGHPVVTSVEQDAAELLVPQSVAATDSAVDTPTMPRTQAQTPPTNAAVPIVGGDESGGTLSRDAGATRGGGKTVPRHVGPGETREQMRGELTEGPATEPSPIESTTGDLIGGRPTTGGMGAAAVPTSETTPPQDTAGTERDAATFAAPAQRATETTGKDGAPDLARLSDDELSNPDAALATDPRPSTGEAVALPYQRDVPSGEHGVAESPGGGSFPSDQAGMTDVFSKATNTAADDTWVEREPDALTETGHLPAGESGPRYDTADVAAGAGAPLAQSAAWRPDELDAVANGPLEATPDRQGIQATPSTPLDSDQSVWVTPQSVLRPNVPSPAAEDETQGLPGWVTQVAAGLGAAALAGGIAAGVLLARRNRLSNSRDKAKKIASATSEGVAAMAGTALAKAQELTDVMFKPAAKEAKTQLRKGAVQAQENAKDAQKQVRRVAKRSARRFRWFRSGLIVGAMAGILFAPASGEDLRTQLASRVEQWRSRIAS